MCKTQIWRSPTCLHSWITLTTPCKEGKNISNCATFENGLARHMSGLHTISASPNSCPRCDQKDAYDGSQIRMIKNVKYGAKLGNGPSKSDQGLELACCNIL